MNLNHYITNDYKNNSRFLTLGKQTQSNPILSAVLSGVAPVLRSFSGEGLAETEALAKADSKWRKPCLTAGTLTQSGQAGAT